MSGAHTIEELEQIVCSIAAKAPETRQRFNEARREICSDLGINQPANRFLLKAYQKLVDDGKLKKNDVLLSFMRKANIRNLSGIAVITSLVKPYSCPGQCVYCPTEVRMPKSYIATEPAAARALRLDFSPYKQVQQRIKMLEMNGHNADKIEYIIKGGTWNAYPLKYQYWFMLESFKAANDLSRENPIGESDEESIKEKSLEQLQQELDDEETFNETAQHRLIGVTLETRPDAITPKTIWHMRKQGCTRIELGLQAPDDEILALVKRGHTVDQFRHAMKLLRDVGFKVDLHFMPDLPGTTAAHDVEMYEEIFRDPALRPDMVKIYPCTVIKSAELYQWLEDGSYTPYSGKDLFWALLEMKKKTPRYCRISRLIRDIPSDVIEAGNSITNLREELEKELTKQGGKCLCLRCREIGRHRDALPKDTIPSLFIEEYETTGGTEYFLTFEDPDRIAVYGFLRLRIPSEERDDRFDEFFPELKDSAFIRELHVYGNLVKIGEKGERATQHKGFGTQLVEAAEEIVKEKGVSRYAVISGVGVRKYYERFGFEKRGTYMVKDL